MAAGRHAADADTGQIQCRAEATVEAHRVDRPGQVGMCTQGAPPEPCQTTTSRPLPGAGGACGAIRIVNRPRATGCSATAVGSYSVTGPSIAVAGSR